MNNYSVAAPQNRRLRVYIWWGTTLAWAGLIFFLSTGTFGGSLSAWLLAQALDFLHVTVSPHTFATVHFLFRKLAHLSEYAIFSLLLYHSLSAADQYEWRARTAFWCVLAAGLYSLTDELHQYFVPGRGPSFIDCGIDTAGAALGMLGVYATERLRQARSSNSAPREESTTEK